MVFGFVYIRIANIFLINNTEFEPIIIYFNGNY